MTFFQGVAENESEEGFRWLLGQWKLLLSEHELEDPLVVVTDYDTAMINAVNYTFKTPVTKHQLCIFHINANIVLQIKKKWKKPPKTSANQAAAAAATPTSAPPPSTEHPNATPTSAQPRSPRATAEIVPGPQLNTAEIGATATSTQATSIPTATNNDPSSRLSTAEIEEQEKDDQDLRQLNAPARGKATMPSKIPDYIPHTRQSLFNLWQFMEYHKSKRVFNEAWTRLQHEFSDQGEIILYLKTYYVDEKIVAKWAGHLICWIDNQGLRTTSSTEAAHRKIKGILKYGFGNIIRLLDCVDVALLSIAKGMDEAEGRQISTQLTAYTGQKWMGDLPRRCAFGGLKMVKQAYDWALDIPFSTRRCLRL